MVYGGKPSLGCKECKRRRIKCDERRPTCLQCEKSRRDCPGYVDELDIIFKNQTVSVTEKAIKRRKCVSPSRTSSHPPRSSQIPQDSHVDEEISSDLVKLSTHSSDVCSSSCFQRESTELVTFSDRWSPSDSSTSTESVYSHNEEARIPRLMRGPTLPLEDQAVTMFFRQIFCTTQTERVKGWPIHLAPMYYAAKPNSALRLSTSAAALAGLSKRPETRHLGPFANHIYGKAMKAVHHALHDPIQCTTDETLQSILSLAFYEISNPMDRSVQAWASHVEGATAIIGTRGTGQFKSNQSVSLFRAVRTQMISSCLLTGTLPKALPFAGSWLADIEHLDDPMFSIAQHILRLPDQRARGKGLIAKNLTPETLAALRELIKEGFDADERMKEWVPMNGDMWHPRTVAYVPCIPKDLENAAAWIGPVHVFPDANNPSAINKQRAARIVNAELIQDCLMKMLPDTYTDDPQYRNAQYIVQSSVDDICYSIPGLLGTDLEDPNWEYAPSFATNDFFASIGAFQLIWPTCVAYGARGISDQQRQWLHGRLNVIGECWGFEQALILKRMLRADDIQQYDI